MSTNKKEVNQPTPDMGEINKLLKEAQDALARSQDEVRNLTEVLEKERKDHASKVKGYEAMLLTAKMVIDLAEINKKRLARANEELEARIKVVEEKNRKLSISNIELAADNLKNDNFRSMWKTAFFMISACVIFLIVTSIAKGAM